MITGQLAPSPYWARTRRWERKSAGRLPAGGYLPGSAESRVSALIIATELAVPGGPLISGAAGGAARGSAANSPRPRAWPGTAAPTGWSGCRRRSSSAGTTRLGSGLSWLCGAPPETAQALAAEAAAEGFTDLGGTSVVLRLGWTYGRADRLTRQILQAAARGWQLLDGPPGAYVPMVEISDAATAAVAALSAPPGLYYVTDGHARNQRELAQIVQEGLGRELHTLADGRWGRGRLFGSFRPGRRITVRGGHRLASALPRRG